MSKTVYLDHSATSPATRDVVEQVHHVMTSVQGNPSSLHGLGWQASRVVEEARIQVAGSLLAAPETIYFTSGGTESNNLVVAGVTGAYRNRGDHIITAATEHSSILEAALRLGDDGFRVTVLPVDKAGEIDLDELASAVTDRTILVSLMHINNETGTVHPIKAIGELLAGYRHRSGSSGRPFFHVDAVQSFARYPLDPGWGLDMLTMSGHKLGGPKGVGALYLRPGVRVRSLTVGGQQERGLRAGTENVPGIAGMGLAVSIMQNSGDKLAGKWRDLSARLVSKLSGQTGPWFLNGPPLGSPARAPHIVNLSFPGVPGEVMTRSLEERGIYVSTGSACHSRDPEPSHVLGAMGLPAERARSAIRVSLGPDTTADDIDSLARELVLASASVRSLTGGRGR